MRARRGGGRGERKGELRPATFPTPAGEQRAGRAAGAVRDAREQSLAPSLRARRKDLVDSGDRCGIEGAEGRGVQDMDADEEPEHAGALADHKVTQRLAAEAEQP